MIYYEILGVNEYANQKKIDDAYYEQRNRLLRKDNLQEDELYNLFKAYTTLSNEYLKAEYNNFYELPGLKIRLKKTLEDASDDNSFSLYDKYFDSVQQAKKRQDIEISKLKSQFEVDRFNLKNKNNKEKITLKEITLKEIIAAIPRFLGYTFIIGMIILPFLINFHLLPDFNNPKKNDNDDTSYESNYESNIDYHNETNEYKYDYDANNYDSFYYNDLDESIEDPVEIIVYITNTGEKYHSYDCRYLSQSCHSIELEEAQYQGYTPCSVCNPPW